jgi:hypothetical protein
MYTHILTGQWEQIPEKSNDSLNYFRNTIIPVPENPAIRNYSNMAESILAEMKAPGGFEYYLCSPIQMETGNVGTYLGCSKSDSPNGKQAKIMIYDHDSQVPKMLDLNDEEYL